jgi:hypothetical protein
MKDTLLACVMIPVWLLILFAVLCFFWMFLVPIYERMCAIALSGKEVDFRPPIEDEIQSSRKEGLWLLFLELLRSSLKYGIVAGIVAIFMPPAAPLVFMFLAWTRWKVIQQIHNPNPEAWLKPLFAGLYSLLFSAFLAAGGLGAIFLAYGSI